MQDQMAQYGQIYIPYKSIQYFFKWFKRTWLLLLKLLLLNLWIIHVNWLTNLCENLYLMQLMSFLNLEVLKRKPIKSIWIVAHVKLSPKKNWDKKFEKQTKIATHMDLWKYNQILTIQKSLTIKQLTFF
jgi:hypothetical protein